MAELTPSAARAFVRARRFADNADDEGTVDAIVHALHGVAIEVASLRELAEPKRLVINNPTTAKKD